MEHAELFLLFPVYEEAADQPAYIKRVGVLEENEYQKFLTKLQDVSSFFCYENYVCYYDSSNLKAFVIPIDTLKDCYPKVSTLFRRKISSWGAIGEELRQQQNKKCVSFWEQALLMTLFVK